jgi:hypothetical protein
LGLNTFRIILGQTKHVPSIVDMAAYNLPWVESPFLNRELEESNLSKEDRDLVESFSQNGYAIIDPKIDLSIIDSLVETLDSKYIYSSNGDSDNPLPQRIHSAWEYNEHVRNVATSPEILRKLQVLYQRKPIPFQTLNFRVGTQQRTHSDMIHFSSIPERFMCGVWVSPLSYQSNLLKHADHAIRRLLFKEV